MLLNIINTFAPEERFNLMLLNDKFSEMFTETPEGIVIINQCMVASHSYKSFRKIRGSAMLDIVQSQDTSLVINDIEEYVWDKKGQSRKQKANFRKKKKALLPKSIIKSVRYIASLVKFYKPSYSYDDIRSIISNSTTNKKDAKKENKLYLPRTRKKHLLKTIKLAEQAGVGMQRFILAAKKYVDFGKSEEALNSILDLSNAMVTQLMGAEVFFSTDLVNNDMISTLLDEYENEGGECYTQDDWKDIAYFHFEYLNGFESTIKKIWDYALIRKRGKTKNRENGYVLLEVVRTFEDYIKAKGLDEYF